VMVAPYAPAGRCDEPHLGAARKIEMVLASLAKVTDRVVLVNTAHNESELSPGFACRDLRVEGVDVTEMLLPRFGSRPLGKLLNLAQVSSTVDRLLEIGRPRVAWLYNGYAFESLIGCTLASRCGTRLIFEYEDSHFSRGRGLNPKPYVDFMCWKRVMPRVYHSFAVNASLGKQVADDGCGVTLFPGLVPRRLSEIQASGRVPFSGETNTLNVGYFGGLSREKGADVVIDICETINSDVAIHVTGAGPLENRFAEIARDERSVLQFHGRVGDERLYDIIEGCDVIINPHSPITEMDGGVFPFKVVEAIASGRLLISTDLPREGFERALQGVRFVGGRTSDFVAAILDAKSWFHEHNGSVRAGAEAAAADFGVAGFLDEIRGLLPPATRD